MDDKNISLNINDTTFNKFSKLQKLSKKELAIRNLCK